MSAFGPKNDAEREVFAIEKFRVDLLHSVQTVMNRQGVNQRELAARLGVTEARVSQVFSAKSNVTAKFLARVFFFLGDECWLDSHHLSEARHERETRRSVTSIGRWQMPESHEEDDGYQSQSNVA